MVTHLAPSVSNHKLSGNTVVHFAVSLAALGMLGAIGLVVLGAGAKKLGVLPLEKSSTQQHAAGNPTDKDRAPQLTAQQTRLLELARADPDYRAWTEVDELTRSIPDDLDGLAALARRLEPIEARWSSQSWSKVIADKLDMARRNQTVDGRNDFLRLTAEAVSKLRSSVRERILQTILTRNLPSLAVSHGDLLSFGKQEGMVEVWDEGGQIESAEWRSWTIAPSSSQMKKGPRRIAKGSYITAECDQSGAVKWVSLAVEIPGDAEYMTSVLTLPKPERELRHADRVKQVLTGLPAIVHRFLLVTAPEQADQATKRAGELADQSSAQILSGFPTGSSWWLAELASGDQRQVEIMVIPGCGLWVSVTQPSVRSRVKEIGELNEALGE